MDNKKILIIICIAIAVYFLFIKKEKEEDKEEDKEQLSDVELAKRSVNAAYNATAEENVEAPKVSAEEEEYNLARSEYRSLYGANPKSSWSITQIEQAIKDKKQVDKLVEEFINKGGSQDILDADEDIITLSEIKNHLSKLNQDYEIAVAKAEEELDCTVDRDTYNTIAKVNQFKNNKLATMKKEWNSIVAELSIQAGEWEMQLQRQAVVANFKKIKDNCDWWVALPDNKAIAVAEKVGWDLLLDSKLGWMKSDTRYTMSQRNSYAAANNRAKSLRNKKVDAYGRVS